MVTGRRCFCHVLRRCGAGEAGEVDRSARGEVVVFVGKDDGDLGRSILTADLETPAVELAAVSVEVVVDGQRPGTFGILTIECR